MAAVCEVCGKKPSFGMNISHSHRRTKRRWNPEHPAGPGPGGRIAQAAERLHLVHPVRARSPSGRSGTSRPVTRAPTGPRRAAGSGRPAWRRAGTRRPYWPSVRLGGGPVSLSGDTRTSTRPWPRGARAHPNRCLTVPPWAPTMAATMARPRPAPPEERDRDGSARKNGSKIRSASAGSIPGPSSWTVSTAHPVLAGQADPDRRIRRECG